MTPSSVAFKFHQQRQAEVVAATAAARYSPYETLSVVNLERDVLLKKVRLVAQMGLRSATICCLGRGGRGKKGKGKGCYSTSPPLFHAAVATPRRHCCFLATVSFFLSTHPCPRRDLHPRRPPQHPPRHDLQPATTASPFSSQFAASPPLPQPFPRDSPPPPQLSSPCDSQFTAVAPPPPPPP
ncbi:chitin-binding lectin 1-like [Arachis stenosperma]|uniref:chitin-binding lectin 1-like n=1 Tax=Arachis stenosperma TaxID=217475 RepID=UPI0025ACDE32|nr:chitin-binding lectin 1-like [Arachis stenosperma]